jgi:hypothetical protein
MVIVWVTSEKLNRQDAKAAKKAEFKIEPPRRGDGTGIDDGPASNQSSGKSALPLNVPVWAR